MTDANVKASKTSQQQTIDYTPKLDKIVNSLQELYETVNISQNKVINAVGEGNQNSLVKLENIQEIL